MLAAIKKHAIRPEDNDLLASPLDPQISPDGKLVAYTLRTSDREKNERHTNIWVAPLDGKAPARRFTWRNKDHTPRWSPDGRYLAFISGRDEKMQVFVSPLDGGDPRPLTKAPHGVTDIAWSPDSARIAYVARVGEWKDAKDRDATGKAAPRVIRDLRYRLDTVGYFDNRRSHIFVIDATSGDETQITSGDWSDQQPSWSPNGRSIAFVSDRERQRHQRQFCADVWSVPSKGGKARRLTRARGNASFPAFSPDGRMVAYVGHEYGGSHAKNVHVLVVSSAGGAPRSISAAVDNTIAPLQAFRWLPNGKSLVFLVQERGTQAMYRAGVANGGVTRVLAGERQIQQFSLSRDGKQIAFTAQFTSTPPEVYATTLGTGGKERNLSHANDAFLAAVDVGASKRMTHRAPDGLEIESFVIYPPGYRAGSRYPLALYIHGGPHAQHPLWGFAMRPQTLAGAGYVVLLPNPRGSSGYGEAFTGMCVQDWGGKDYEDIMTAVDTLVAKGVADPGRLYVTGYSYGGFMTTWTVGHTNRFRAAIIGAPVADHISMRGTTDIPHFSDFELGGTPFDSLETMWERSPLKYLPNCTTPVLIEHHEGDLRCPIGQAEEIFQTLKLAGKEVEFLRYPGGFHILEFHAPSQDVDYQQRQIAWFDSHGGRPKSTPQRKRAKLRGATPSRNGAKPAKERVRA